jgi:Tfp pilus assembly protein PilN
MKAVNLIPAGSRRSKSSISVGTVGPGHFLVALLAIVVVLVLIRVLTDNTINDRKATLAAVQTQVATEQAAAARLTVYTQFVQAAEQREAAVRAIAEARFPWMRSFDQLGHVMPATTSLKTLTATIAGSAPPSGAAAATVPVAVPTFTLDGCADTRNMDGVATLIRRLRQLSGATTVGFQNSARQPQCGNQFNLIVAFKPLPGTAAPAAAPATSTTTGTTTSTTPSATTTTTRTTG